jgi:hypothetical protein
MSNLARRLEIFAKLIVKPINWKDRPSTSSRLRRPPSKYFHFHDLVTGNGGVAVNEYLNKGIIDKTKSIHRPNNEYNTKTKLKNAISAIDNVFAKHSYPHEGGIVHRYVHSVRPSRFHVGKTYTQKGYMHVTTNKSALPLIQRNSGADHEKIKLLMYLKVPKNHPIINAMAVAFPEEEEHILPRGTRYKINKIISGGRNNPTHIYGIILPHQHTEVK